MTDLSQEIRAYALKNALEFGTADAARILPKLFQHGLQKNDITTIMQVIQKTVKEVNALSQHKREQAFQHVKHLVKEREEKEHDLPELPHISKNMVFRLAPYPSGALHIGNAKTYLLNALYAEKYKAELLLVMDDTIGSEEKKPLKEAYQLIESGFQWLNIHYHQPVIYKSDRLPLYYDAAEQLIKKDAAYICNCSQQQLRKNREQGKACKHRAQSTNENMQSWKAMFKAKPGEAVLRIKTSMQHPNPAFRDRVLFKISDRPHPRIGKKVRVWPTLEMSWAIDDHLLNITHILRGNDLMIETDMERFIWDLFGWKHPVIIHTGLITIEGIEGAKLSKSKAQHEVTSGAWSSWDDPRSWSLQSLKRRGITPEAVHTFMKNIGLNKQDITIPIETLYALDRQRIDADAERHVFIEHPIKLTIENAPSLTSITMPLHPDKPQHTQTFIVKPGIIVISQKDMQTFKGKEVRLLHLYNIKLPMKGTKALFTSLENKDIPKITWVSQSVEARVLMPDGTWTPGLADENIASLKEGSVIQFERFGFARFDTKNKSVYEFWFAHP